jgi:hypothetical protein
MAPLSDATTDYLWSLLNDYVERGTNVITDGWSGYSHIDKLGYIHHPRSQRAARARG